MIAFAMLLQSLFELCLSANVVFAKQGAKCRYVERQLCTSGFQLAFAGVMPAMTSGACRILPAVISSKRRLAARLISHADER
jgi:hypothetical protein